MNDDDGIPDLSKIQMLAWTLIAIVTYLIRVIENTKADPVVLPDIPVDHANDASILHLVKAGYCVVVRQVYDYIE